MIDFAQIAATAQGRLKNILARVVFGGAQGSERDAQVLPDSEVWQQFGFASRPSPGNGTIEALMVPLEGGCVVIATRQQRTQIALAEGDVALFNGATGCVVRLTAAGRVEVNAASGQDIVLNGGTLDVARQTDAVEVTIPRGTTFTGTVGTSPATFTLGTELTVSGRITGDGALHVKA